MINEVIGWLNPIEGVTGSLGFIWGEEYGVPSIGSIISLSDHSSFVIWPELFEKAEGARELKLGRKHKDWVEKHKERVFDMTLL